MRLAYDVVDVFTDRAYVGNPLAVVHGAEHLRRAQLNAITREFNLSETTFPIPLDESDRAAGVDYRVRIFTPAGEIPFAGHPTLGTAWVLHDRGQLQPGNRTQACLAGSIGVSVPADPGAELELQAAPQDLSSPLPAEAVAAVASAVALAPDDVVQRVYAAGCGLNFVHLPVRPEALARARPGDVPLGDLSLGELDVQGPLEGVNVFAVAESGDATKVASSGERSAGLQIRSRVFVPGLSVPEDPATGSAAVGLGIVLAALGLAKPEGETRFRIEQGVEMGRRSLLHGRVEAAQGRATRCWVAGQVVRVATGTLVVPD